MPVLDLQVAASTDNITVWYYLGEVEGWLYQIEGVGGSIGLFSGWQFIDYRKGLGCRFLNVTIPRCAVIKEAYLVVTAYSDYSANTVNSVIAGNAEDNAATFSNEVDYQARCGTRCDGANNDKRTSASVTWNSIEAFTKDEEYQSPDIKTVIQEIVNRAGWESGNALALFWEDHAGDTDPDESTAIREVYYYDGSPTKAVKLHIEYNMNGLFTFHG